MPLYLLQSYLDSSKKVIFFILPRNYHEVKQTDRISFFSTGKKYFLLPVFLYPHDSFLLGHYKKILL